MLTCMCVRSLRSPGVIPWSHKLRPYTQRFCIRSIAHVPDIRPAERDARKCRRSSAGGLLSLKRRKNKRMQRHCNLMSNLVFWCHITVSSKMSMRPNSCNHVPVAMIPGQSSRTWKEAHWPIEEPSPEAATPTNRASLSFITDFDMCKVCTEALWTRTLSQVWTCVKYVPKQSTA